MRATHLQDTKPAIFKTRQKLHPKNTMDQQCYLTGMDKQLKPSIVEVTVGE